MKYHTLNEETEDSILDDLQEQLSDLFETFFSETGLGFDGIFNYDLTHAILNCLVSFPIHGKNVRFFDIHLCVHWRDNAGIYELIFPEQSKITVSDLTKIANKLKSLNEALTDKSFMSEFLEVIATAMDKIENL